MSAPLTPAQRTTNKKAGTKRRPTFPVRIFYVGLESYSSRYSYQLTLWNMKAFERMKIPFTVINSDYEDIDDGIKVGQVLDAYRRPKHAMQQIMRLLDLIERKKIGHDDVIFFEDMFHPGIEALGYALDQMPEKDRPFISMRCLAQTIDPDDFVHERPRLAEWMRHYERMTLRIADQILVASEEMLTHFQIAGWPIENARVTGLPFGKDEVQSRVYTGLRELKNWQNRPWRVVFASRVDWEKQPAFFINLAEQFRKHTPKIEFAILSGKKIKSNAAIVDYAIKEAKKEKTIKVYEDLSKNDYYALLAGSRVLFNCAYQDWVSNTVSEADALNTNVLFPAHRSFPEVFQNDRTRMYVPWSVDDAIQKLLPLLENPHSALGDISDYQDMSIDRTVSAIFSGMLKRGGLSQETQTVLEQRRWMAPIRRFENHKDMRLDQTARSLKCWGSDTLAAHLKHQSTTGELE